MGRPVVNVKQGWLRGRTVENVVGGSYISFKGIPYAQPPVGNLRFKEPQPPRPWTGIRDAIAEGPKCAQFDVFTKSIIGGDDCLYLNVATTSLTGSRPVMVWIHGGAFLLGDGGYDLYSPDYLMRSDIVHVGINYRVGVLGFLNLDHEVAPGNAGLKDQVAALKWVKENIAQFGGDPNNVTIFGESAGGASVHYLILSPLAKGLFHKAIAQSGVVLNPWARVMGNSVDIVRRYVVALGKDLTDPKEIVEYLRSLPVERLIDIQENIFTSQEKVNLILPFGPGIDDKSAEPFFPKTAEELAAEGFDVPVMIGYTSHEGIIFLMGLQDEAYTKLDENFELMIPRDLARKAASKVPEVAKEIRKFYFGDKPITKDLVEEFIQCCGDLYFFSGIRKVVDIQKTKKSPTYFYRFSYDSPNSITKTMFQVQANGAMHAEEIQYLFWASQFDDHINIQPGSTEETVRNRMVRMWTDFAKTGNPTPLIDDLITVKWEPITSASTNYLEIGAELTPGQEPSDDVWETLTRVQDLADSSTSS